MRRPHNRKLTVRKTARDRRRTWLACYALLRCFIAQIHADDFIRGDVNGDGKVTLTDVNARIDLPLSGLSFPCEDAADVNDDGALGTSLFTPPPSDIVELLDWLFSLTVPPVSAPAPLPAPFPLAGPDPPAADGVDDGLTCVDGFSAPPAPPNGAWQMEWEIDPEDKIGDFQILLRNQEYQLFLRVHTAEAVDGFSVAYQINTDTFDVLGVDFVSTELPFAEQAGFATSTLFRWELLPTTHPGVDVLIAGALFYHDALTKIDFSLTQGGVVDKRALRVHVRTRSDAPAGLTTLLKPFPGGYSGGFSDNVGGILNEFVVGRNIAFPLELKTTSATIEPDGITFIRADANGDGNIDVSDPVFTLLALFHNSPGMETLLPADANNDRQIDISDPLFTLNYLFLNAAAPDPPFPDCGTIDDFFGPLKALNYLPCSPMISQTFPFP